MIPIRKSDWQVAVERNKYFAGRWVYYREAIDLACKQNPVSILEIGCLDFPLFRDSVTLDVNGHPSIHHDLRKTPWPFPDKAFDLGIALQVWEHLDGFQQVAFAELRRVCRRAILSFPYLWCCQDNCHHNITEGTIARWTLNHPWLKVVIVPPHNTKRALYLFDFLDARG